ncbi:GNAT family N-acetyltransferase [Solicola sp. PLA-1-18]|uniref:GNAT family N-acetyltransferase n=1 Tax=Solicola sp. PLA-1-18 TaxID=3380532 RepID=UPI003B7C5E28
MTPVVQVAHTAHLEPRVLEAAHALLHDVFDDLEPTDWQHCLGGLHALAWDGDLLVGHSALVQRRLVHGDRVLRCGYVEGVAVRTTHRRRGVGGLVMEPLERAADLAYDVGALASSDEGLAFYAARGWHRWEGRTAALTPDGVRPTPDDDGCIFLRPALPASPDLLVCDWREGDRW